MNKLLPLSVLALATAQAAYAETDNKLEEVVVTSSRVPMPLRQVGTSVSVIAEAEIQALGYANLADILRTQAAIGVSNTGGAGSPTTVRIRGEEGYRTRVYIDGIDLSNTSGVQSSPNFEHMQSSGVTRVEILRGPQGLMYGADAGGIVNISTASEREGLQGHVSAEGGRYGTQQIAADAAGGNGVVDFSINASDFETDGFNARTDDTVLRDDDGYENTTLHGRIGINASDTLRFELVARDVDAEGEYDDCFTADFSPSNLCSNDFEQQAYRASAQLNYEIFTHELSYTENETDRQAYTENAATFGGDGELKRWTYLGNYRGSDALALVYGLEYEEESFNSGGLDHERDQDSAFMEYQGGFGDSLYLTAGLRYDDNEDFGSHNTYRVSGAYVIDLSDSELKFKGAYGTGFRAPSLYEVAYNEGDFAYPPASNINLKEEESAGYDIGVIWATNGGIYLEANYFDQKITDEIYFDLVDFSGYLQADGDIDSTGVELIGQFELGDSVSLTGNYTYNDTESGLGQQRIRRPEHLANLGLQWHPLDARLLLGINARGSYDAVAGDGSKLDDYQVVDINASFDIWQGLSVYGRVENLFDEDYEEVPGFNTAGTAAYAGVRYSF